MSPYSLLALVYTLFVVPQVTCEDDNASSSTHDLDGRLEFFSHIVHTGGTAWSRWLTATYGAQAVAPGSSVAAPMYSGMQPPFGPQFAQLKNVTTACVTEPSCHVPQYAVAFGEFRVMCIVDGVPAASCVPS